VTSTNRTRAPIALIALALVAAITSTAQAALIFAIAPTAVAPGSSLLTFDSATPGTVTAPLAVTGLQAGEFLLGIDFRPANGQLYGLGSTSRLYNIDPATGAATQLGSAGAFTLSGTSFGFDFNPTVDRIRVVSNTGQNLRLNPNDGTLTATDTALAYDNTTADGDPIDPNAGATPFVVGAAYANNVNGAATTTLFGIDSSLDILLTQNPPNAGVLNTIGALGFNTGDRVGFDILTTGGVGGTDTAFASLAFPASSTSQLFSINLTSGSATLVGTIGNTSLLIQDIAVAPQGFVPPGGGGPNVPLPPALLVAVPPALLALRGARKTRK
jgi:hypothetical protein